MFGTVEIIDTHGNIHKADIAKINEPYIDGSYIEGFDSQTATLMWDSIDIIMDHNVGCIKSIEIKELRDVQCDGASEGYCLDGRNNLKIINKHYFGEGKVLLKCL